jgi:histidine ammonia-lyase
MMSDTYPLNLNAGQMTLHELRQIWQAKHTEIVLSQDAKNAIKASRQVVDDIVARGDVVYGVNTGFGKLANTVIAPEKLETLQENLILSHAAGTGEAMPANIVRLILALKINSLAQGYSGVRAELIDALVTVLNSDVIPLVPAQGSVGASGDLVPLAHMSCLLLGHGEALQKGVRVQAKEALKSVGLQPLRLAPKEGLALINGTQVSAALALSGLFSFENSFAAALKAGALSLEAAKGSPAPFRREIQAVRKQKGQIEVAEILADLLKDSPLRDSHHECGKVQDPYSLRCMPQVLGACLDQLRHSAMILEREANAVSDNPLVFPETGEILSGGNFHAEPVGMAADNLALAVCETGSISERRTAMLIDDHHSGLPAFLVDDAGVNSGFMIAHVTAAALVSENKQRAMPAVVDSIPTSANQEDHVSMATHGARRLIEMSENLAAVIAIELLAAAQGIEFHRPLETSPKLEQTHRFIRKYVQKYDRDRLFAPDIEAIKRLILKGEFNDNLECYLPSMRVLCHD